jgi:hypothetical protein
MANQTVGELNVVMNLELTKLQGQIDSANKRIANMARKAHSDVSLMAKNINRALGAIGIGASISGVIAFGKSVVALGGQITDAANAAGIGTDAFQTLSIAAMDTGVNMDQLAKAGARLRVATQDAVEGNKQLQSAFAKLGISATALKTLSLERQFELIGQKIGGATDQSEAFKAAVDILGANSAPKLIAFLRELGTDGFDKISDGLKRIRLNSEQLKTLDNAGDKLARMWGYIKLIGAKAVVFAASPADGNNRYVANPFGLPDTGAAATNAKIAARNAPTGATAAAQVLRELDAQVAASDAKTTAQELYNTAVQKQIDDYTKLSNLDIVRNKRLDALSVAFDQNAAAIDKTWRSLSATKDIGLALDAAKPFAFDPDKIAAATTEWDRFVRGQQTIAEVESDLNLFFGSLDKSSKAFGGLSDTERIWAQETAALAGNAADALSSSFVDAINGVEGAFSNLGEVIVQQIEKIIVQTLIVVPLMRMIGGALGGLGLPTGAGTLAGAFSGFGGAKAGGGDVAGYATYLVGEDGPELFTPRASGTIIPNDRLGSMTASAPASVYNFTYNIPAGITRADLIPILRMQEKHTLTALRDRQRRGKA